MKIKLLFIVTLFLSGIAVQFAGAMEGKQELVCSGKVTSIIEQRITGSGRVVVEVGFEYQNKPYKKIWDFEKNKIIYVKSHSENPNQTFVELKNQNSTVHSTPITKATAVGTTFFTVSYNKKEDKSCIKTTPLPNNIVIKTSDSKTVMIEAKEKNIEICCISTSLLDKLARKQEQDKEISLDVTKDQFMDAHVIMDHVKCGALLLDVSDDLVISGLYTQSVDNRKVIDDLLNYSVERLVDLILVDNVLKIKDKYEKSLSTCCLSVIKNKINKYETDALKKDCLKQAERLPEVHQREIVLHVAKNIAKDFVAQTKDGKQYPAWDLDQQLCPVWGMKLGPDGIAVSMDKDVIKIAKNGKEAHRFNDTDTLTDIAASHTLDDFGLPCHIVTLGQNKKVTVWSSENQEQPSYSGKVVLNVSYISSIAITQDGKFAAIVIAFKDTQIWDLEDNTCLMNLNYQAGFNTEIMFAQEEILFKNSTITNKGQDKKFYLENFFRRMDLIKKMDVRTADFVNRLAKKVPSNGHILLTPDEYDELEASQHRDAIKSVFSIRKAEPAEKKEDGKRTSNKFSSLTNYLPTFRNFIKGSFLTIGAFSIIYFIVYNMNH